MYHPSAYFDEKLRALFVTKRATNGDRDQEINAIKEKLNLHRVYTNANCRCSVRIQHLVARDSPESQGMSWWGRTPTLSTLNKMLFFTSMMKKVDQTPYVLTGTVEWKESNTAHFLVFRMVDLWNYHGASYPWMWCWVDRYLIELVFHTPKSKPNPQHVLSGG